MRIEISKKYIILCGFVTTCCINYAQFRAGTIMLNANISNLSSYNHINFRAGIFPFRNLLLAVESTWSPSYLDDFYPNASSYHTRSPQLLARYYVPKIKLPLFVQIGYINYKPNLAYVTNKLSIETAIGLHKVLASRWDIEAKIAYRQSRFTSYPDNRYYGKEYTIFGSAGVSWFFKKQKK